MSLFDTSMEEWDKIHTWCLNMAAADYSQNNVDLRGIRQEHYWYYLEEYYSSYGSRVLENTHGAFVIMQDLQNDFYVRDLRWEDECVYSRYLNCMDYDDEERDLRRMAFLNTKATQWHYYPNGEDLPFVTA
ncbi:uncharacterized protein LOC62_04G006552 [Vanrija pseudolonga]|uniref:Uncharacterized protein n=1 Tax=Vanrija pseudolonga TaxID=143232 RepID=A0AAF1BNE7_9TREE|nr:hypothetical protein LOC62_04G006552 [Vanrija pseudolonga]